MKKSRLWRRLKRKTGITVTGSRRVGKAQAKGAKTPRKVRDTSLAKARNAIQKGKTAKGLTLLEKAASAKPANARKVQIAALAADGEFKKGDFAKAAAGYKQAGLQAADHPRIWLRASLGQVRAHLKDANVPAAKEVAAAAWAKAVGQHEEEQRKLAVDQAKATGKKIRIGKRPHRASVVASRLGLLFRLEGETDLAREYFQKAIEINPLGGSRARQGLAAVALASGNAAEAEKRARESILLGKFQRKTIATWPILIAARQRQGLKGIDADFIAAIRQSQEPSVRARCILVIAKALRDHGDDSWTSIAEDWQTEESGKFPLEATELRKLKLATLRREARDYAGQSKAADELLQNPALLSASEYLAATKESVRAALWAGKIVKLDKVIAKGEKHFGKVFSLRLSHGLAVACSLARRQDLSATLLADVIASSTKGSALWRRAAYSLAHLKVILGKYEDAAQLYDQFANNQGLPLRFRCKARVEWARNLTRIGSAERIAAAGPSLIAACRASQDPDLIMDVARQLDRVAPRLKASAEELFGIGYAMGVRQFDAEQHPSKAATMLMVLARHQRDFLKHSNVVQTWLRLSRDQRQWLWSEKGDFWEYVRLVLDSMYVCGRFPDAKHLEIEFLNDPSTPAAAVAALCCVAGDWRVRSGHFPEAKLFLQRALDAAPNNMASGPAYYWQSLSSLKRGDNQASISYANSLLRILGAQPALLSNVILQRKALCLAAGMDVSLVPPQQVRHSPEKLAAAISEIALDLEKIPS
jgi:tetratricopeptide (TPR) repeat protein